MTPIERAKYIIHSFVIVPDNAMKKGSTAAWIDTKLAKQCAIICVEQILEAVTTIADKKYDYWKEVLDYLKAS